MKNQHANFYIITGGPGVGKTTLINALNQRGFQTVQEDARRIIKEQKETNGDGLPWMDKQRYAKLMFDASVESYNKTNSGKISNVTFFDRGILDTICYMKLENIQISEKLIEIANTHPYHKNVFILPPWKEIYKRDNERKQNWAEAEFTFKEMKETYLDYNYHVIEVPKVDVEARLKFILQRTIYSSS